MPKVNDSDLVAARITGASVEAIAKRFRVTAERVNAAIDVWSNLAKDKGVRDAQFALELARLDELQRVHHEKAMAGDAKASNFVLKVISQRAALMGLFTQPAAMHVYFEAQRDDAAHMKVRSALAEISQRLAGDTETRH